MGLSLIGEDLGSLAIEGEEGEVGGEDIRLSLLGREAGKASGSLTLGREGVVDVEGVEFGISWGEEDDCDLHLCEAWLPLHSLQLRDSNCKYMKCLMPSCSKWMMDGNWKSSSQH